MCQSSLRNLLLAALSVAILSGCATQDMNYGYGRLPAETHHPGALLGAVHGAISPLTLVGSLTGKCSVYAVPNNGLGYDIGFALGVALLPFVVGVFRGGYEATERFRWQYPQRQSPERKAPCDVK